MGCGCAEKYFKMKKHECKESLEIYKKFLTRVTKIAEFMKIAEVGKQRLNFTVYFIYVDFDLCFYIINSDYNFIVCVCCSK